MTTATAKQTDTSSNPDLQLDVQPAVSWWDQYISFLVMIPVTIVACVYVVIV
jgi:hypothetical protein